MGLSLLAALACFGLPLAAGWGLLRALGVRAASDRLAFAGWAWTAGAFLTGLVVLAWLWSEPDTSSPLVPALGVAALALLCAWIGRRVAPAPGSRAPVTQGGAPRAEAAHDLARPFHAASALERAFFGATTALVLALSAGRILLGTLRPVVEDDEANFWALKAQMLFAHGGFSAAFEAAASVPNRLYNADYPLWNQCLQVWTFAHAGELLHVANRLPVQLFGLALVLVLAAALRRVVRPAVAALLLVCLTSVFELGSQLQRAHGDLLVGLGALIAGDAWLRWQSERHPAWRRLAFLGLACMLWSKNEGQLFLATALCAALLLALARHGRRPLRALPPLSRAWVWALLPAAVLALNHALNARFGWVSGFLAGAERDATIVGLLVEQLPARAGPIAAYYAREIVLDRAHSGGLLLLFLALCVCFPRTLARSSLALPALVVLGVYAGQMLVFAGAPHDLTWHLSTAARRVAFQPLALATLVVGALAGRTLPALASSGRGAS